MFRFDKKKLLCFQILDGLGNHDTHSFADDEVSFDSIANLRANQSLRHHGWVVVDTWTTR